MIKTCKELLNALNDRIAACAAAGVDTKDPATVAWYEADELSVKLKHLWNTYWNAHSAAKSLGYVGVGQISFAEAALQEEQFEPAL